MIKTNSLKNNQWILLLLFLMAIGSFLVLEKRSDFYQLIVSYTCCFGLYFWLIQLKIDLSKVLTVGILARVIILFSPAVLSDDYYRYIWDGLVTSEGLSSYCCKPSSMISLHPAIYSKLNSQEFYSVYPPTSQFIFWLNAVLTKGSIAHSIIFLRSIIFISELVTFYFLKKIFILNKWDISKLAQYILCPLVIIEFTGGIHYEALMVMFICAALYFYYRYKERLTILFLILSSFCFSLSVYTKLWPLLFAIPLLLRIPPKHIWIAILSFIVISILSWLPLLEPNSLAHISDSLHLYFKYFEFNESLYGIAKRIAHTSNGLSLVFLRILMCIGFLYVYWKLFKNKSIQLLHGFYLLILIYFICSSTLHPWYLATLAFFGLLSSYKTHLIWLSLVPFTYITYINEPHFEQNMWFIFIEYLIVCIHLIYQIYSTKRTHIEENTTK